MTFHLTRTKSLAQPPEDFEPQYGIKPEELVDLTHEAPLFLPTSLTSRARSPEKLQADGRLLLGIGNGAIGCSASISTENETDRRLGKFREKGASLYYVSFKDGNPTQKIVANFTIVPVEWRCHMTLHGELRYLYGYAKTAGRRHAFKVAVERIPTLLAELRVHTPTLRLDSECRNAEALFREYVSTVIEAAGELPTHLIYEFAGWGFDNIYHHGGMSDCLSARILPDTTMVDDRQAFEGGLMLLTLGEQAVTLPILLQALAGVLAKPFEDAGIPLQYILSIVGPSGSKKTSLAKVAYCHFDQTEVINFTATDRALELQLEAGHDGVTVIDDLASVLNKAYMVKFDRILRQVGDSAGRKKSVNGGRAIETVSTRTAVVVTAESQIEGLQQSGLLRLFQVPIHRDSIDNARLEFFQANQAMAKLENRASIMEIFLTCFIHYVEKNYQPIVRFITTYRPPELPLESDRHARVYRCMGAIGHILLKWGISCGAVSENDGAQIVQNWLHTMEELARFNDNIGCVHDPIKTYLQTLGYGISRKEILIAESKDKFCLAPQNFYGFHADDFLYLDPIRAYEYVMKHAGHQSISFTLSDIAARLRDKKLLRGYEQKNHKSKPYRTIKLNGAQMKLFCLDVKRVREYLNEESERLHYVKR